MISKANIKSVKSLHQKKIRDAHNQFIVEGEKMVLEAIRWKSDFLVALYHTSDFPTEEIDATKINLIAISDHELKQISGLQTPNKALAVFDKWPLETVNIPFYIALDGVQDPGNMGTILRLADWFGVEEIICSMNTVDCFNPKVVQATMGAIFRIQVRYVDLKSHLLALKMPVYGALLEGENIYKSSLKPEGILILGNEGNGISEEIKQLIDYPISIPRFGEAESLNVSTAGAILLSEFFRGTI